MKTTVLLLLALATACASTSGQSAGGITATAAYRVTYRGIQAACRAAAYLPPPVEASDAGAP